MRCRAAVEQRAVFLLRYLLCGVSGRRVGWQQPRCRVTSSAVEGWTGRIAQHLQALCAEWHDQKTAAEATERSQG